MLSWMVITYAMQFGEKKTQKWLLSWVFASMHAWLIVEPAEVRVRVRVRVRAKVR